LDAARSHYRQGSGAAEARQQGCAGKLRSVRHLRTPAEDHLGDAQRGVLLRRPAGSESAGRLRI